jgi:H+/Na+-translocating ferredoxin:NAD+ oxidoreductase subunit C
MHTESPTSIQQPCIHCGECARACPQALNPEALFFAMVEEDWARARAERLPACTQCNRCVEVCPSHIPLLDWLRWGLSELPARARADAARARFLARDARLARERAVHAPARHEVRSTQSAAVPAQTISRNDVLAAIARGRSKVRATVPDRRTTDSAPTSEDKDS